MTDDAFYRLGDHFLGGAVSVHLRRVDVGHPEVDADLQGGDGGGAIAFLGGNYYGYQWYAAKMVTLKGNLADLQSDQEISKDALKETDQWKQYKGWLNDKQPPLNGYF